jgi:hypothetical protein
MSFDISKGFLLKNNYDLSVICQGRIIKDLFKQIVHHFSKKELPVCAVYIPSNRRSDLFDWVSVDTKSEYTIPLEVQEQIWNENKDNVLIPSIIFTNSIDTSQGIYCYAVGTKDIELCKNKHDIPFEDIENKFGKENIMSIKIG